MNVLIIGGSNWLGKALASAVSSKENQLILVARNEARLNEVKDNITSCRVEIIKCDLVELNAIDDAVKEITKIFERIDLVLNVAGGSYVGRTFESGRDTFEYMINAYIRGQTYFIKALIPLFRSSKNSLIINFLSDWAVRKAGMESGNALYTMTKIAMAVFSECLMSEEHVNGIKITNLYLGELTEDTDDSKIPKDDNGNPDLIMGKDICEFVLFLLESSTIHLSEATLITKSPGYARKYLHTTSSEWDQ